MEISEIDNLGNVNMKFNRKILKPRIEILSDRRALQDSPESGLIIPKVKIEDFLRLEVSFEDFFESYDKSILGYTATSVDEYSIKFNVRFGEPSEMSTDINTPDYLRIEFLMPELIVDAESFKHLAE